MDRFRIKITPQFHRRYKKLAESNPNFRKVFNTKIAIFIQDPFYKGLFTHKYRSDYSTRITGDIRVIWNFSSLDGIILYNIGGHEGKSKVYD